MLIKVKCYCICVRALIFSLLQQALLAFPCSFSISLIIHQSLNKGNHDRGGVWMSDPNLHRCFRFISLSFPEFYFRVKRYIKHCLSVWPHFPTPRSSLKILHCASYFQLSSLLGVLKCGQTRSFVFVILRHTVFFGKKNRRVIKSNDPLK